MTYASRWPAAEIYPAIRDTMQRVHSNNCIITTMAVQSTAELGRLYDFTGDDSYPHGPNSVSSSTIPSDLSSPGGSMD
ncbi:hypothetical protein BV898_08084 [Hypsibius exemplaris]|uniref:Uncharacterized protein n=1 Tax=Hypsibius exemplaris TaxID=2072580 RepID=A0A1W0WRF8_HYPEX|nr:hypothetical protein BV898_08084 [Hypsibius exemplaris]